MKDPLFAKRTFIEKLRSMRFDERDLKLIENAVQLLGTTNFKDPKKKNYSAHPLRVAGYVMSYDPSVEAATVVLALLHNMLEVADLLPSEVRDQFGEWVYQSCFVFKVDRARQKSDQAYLKDFYSQFKSDRRLLLIKMFDKFDNVLSLYFNPDQEVRRRYLDEIEHWLIPCISDCDALMRDAFLRLIAGTRSAQPVSMDTFLTKGTA